MLDLDVELVYNDLVPTRQRDEQRKATERKKIKKFRKVLDKVRNSDIIWVHERGCHSPSPRLMRME